MLGATTCHLEPSSAQRHGLTERSISPGFWQLGHDLKVALTCSDGIAWPMKIMKELWNNCEIIMKVNEAHPYPYRGGGRRGGQNQPVEFHFFLLGNPGIVIQPLKWNCKVTFLNKPWALVWKYLRLAPEELSASMITAAQIFGGMPSLHMCCFSLTCA